MCQHCFFFFFFKWDVHLLFELAVLDSCSLPDLNNDHETNCRHVKKEIKRLKCNSVRYKKKMGSEP